MSRASKAPCGPTGARTKHAGDERGEQDPERGGPPPGMAIVTFTADSLDGTTVQWRSPPRAVADFPYRGRRVAVTVGPAGEWVEVVETPAEPGPTLR